ncbi:MAG: DUF2877 domain-containing protein [Actinobacteria bacterium]|uniref:Unannotated protein n=1 Tax=freshwater metagenome TaxID=449393 RepID=A0A6J6QBA5_9ZZZZ|nr:DUF2877 domain-containing protein [Actinomycetota bacterium]
MKKLLSLPVAAPPRVLNRLRAAQDLGLVGRAMSVVHHGEHALYLELDGWCLGVVDEQASALPNALRMRTSDYRALNVTSAHLGQGGIVIGGAQLVIGRLCRVDAPALSDAALVGAHDFPAHFPRLEAMHVGGLVGHGEGLTPTGDDILCGWLAVHRAFGIETPEVDAAIRRRLADTTLLSSSLLDCALHGEVVPTFGAYLESLGTPQEPERARAVAEIGHTTGHALLQGARWALRDLSSARVSAA